MLDLFHQYKLFSVKDILIYFVRGTNWICKYYLEKLDFSNG